MEILNQLNHQLLDLFSKTGQLHADAFIALDGEDAEWPIWYAEHLKNDLNSLLKTHFTVSELAYFLVQIENERQLFYNESEWPKFYAEKMLNKFLFVIEPSQISKKTLYYSENCHFCATLINKIKDLGLDLELKEINRSTDYSQELIEAAGRLIVPSIMIGLNDHRKLWYTDSTDMIFFLENQKNISLKGKL